MSNVKLGIFHFFLDIIEFFYKKKLLKVLKKNLPNQINVLFDIGAHKGETTISFAKIFEIKQAFLFEPSPKNYKKILNKTKNLKSSIDMNIFNFAIGDENKKTLLNEVFESSSSTINQLNKSSDYFKRKKKILSYFNDNVKINQFEIQVNKGLEFIEKNKIKKIDLLKIDTEGFEYIILKNIENYLKNVGVIIFEHHYDLMINKDYTSRDIKGLLVKNNFKQIYKSKMILRKSFEYIYKNEVYSFDK